MPPVFDTAFCRLVGEVAALALVPHVVDAVEGTPVVAADGVGDGRGLAAVLTFAGRPTGSGQGS